MKLDNLDEKILAELDNDARTPNTLIAKKLRTNKNVINYRIKNLEKSGIIKGYYAIIDSYKLGYQGYRLYLKFQYTNPEKEAEIMDYFVKNKNSWWVSHLKGSWDVAVISWFKNQKELVETMNDFLSKYRNFVEDHILIVYYGLGHCRLPFAKKYLKEKAKFERVSVGEVVEVDQTDLSLLRFLSSNARAPLTTIAKKLNLTPAAVAYRLKQLIKKKIILGFRPIFDIQKLGYSQYKLDINVKDTSIVEKINKFAIEHDNIFYLNWTLGYTDVELEIYVNNQKQFFDIIKQIRNKFSEHIKDYNFFIFEKITKIKYMPS